MAMKRPPHPGLSIRHDCLAPLGLSVTAAARGLGVSRKQLSDVLNGHAGISPEMAIRLDKAEWVVVNGSREYLAQAMERADAITVTRLTAA